MLLVSCALLTTSSVALLGHARRMTDRSGGGIAAALAAFASARVFGGLVGAIVWVVLAMTVASALVLVLPPRPTLARPVALATGLLGLIAGAIDLLEGRS